MYDVTNNKHYCFWAFQKISYEWKGSAEPTAAKVQQSSWIQLDSIVIAALVFGIGLVVVVVVNLLSRPLPPSS